MRHERGADLRCLKYVRQPGTSIVPLIMRQVGEALLESLQVSGHLSYRFEAKRQMPHAYETASTRTRQDNPARIAADEDDFTRSADV
jgi:hypothetical protein